MLARDILIWNCPQNNNIHYNFSAKIKKKDVCQEQLCYPSNITLKMNDSCIHETNCILLEGDSEALFFGGKVDLLIHPGKQKTWNGVLEKSRVLKIFVVKKKRKKTLCKDICIVKRHWLKV